MPLISLCIIARNEESVLGRCLDSVADLVDEIILVDTGSTDRTKAAAAEYAAKIYDFSLVRRLFGSPELRRLPGGGRLLDVAGR